MDYISKPALMGKLTSSEEQQKIKAMSGADAYNEFLMLVNGTMKADVAPVRRGYWIPNYEYEDFIDADCSVCGKKSDFMYKYCHYCGSLMDGGADNGE